MNESTNEAPIDQTEEDMRPTKVSDEALEAAARTATGADPTGHSTGSKACC